MRDLDYLKLLAKEYPTVKAASSEIINLMAIRGLPKQWGRTIVLYMFRVEQVPLPGNFTGNNDIFHFHYT